MTKLQKGDTVVVLKGGDKKKVGKVLSVMRDSNRVVVAGVNLRTKHRKPRTQEETGTIEKKEMSIAVSNVALADPKDNKPTRIGCSGIGKDKVRIARRSGATVKKPSGGKKAPAKSAAVSTKAATTKTVTKKAAVKTPVKKTPAKTDEKET